MVKLQAIDGVSTEYPRSTLSAFLAAAEQRYDSIYLDLDLAENGQLIAAGNDAEMLKRPKFSGMKPASVTEVLALMSRNGLKARIGSSWSSLSQDAMDALRKLLYAFEGTAELTCRNAEALKTAADSFPAMPLHYDGPLSREILETLRSLVPDRKLTVWLFYEQRDLVPMVKEFASAAFHGLHSYQQLDTATTLGVSEVSTRGQLKHTQNEGLLSDMHCHSRNSMDADVPILDLALGELDAGVTTVAVADHCEMQWLDNDPNYDLFSFLLDCRKEIDEVQAQLGDKIELLMGIELGQAAWYPEDTARVLSLLPYDIVVGAVHSIKDPDISDFVSATMPWQHFMEEANQSRIHRILERYFDEAMTMARSVNIDSLAHLTFVARTAEIRKGYHWDLTRHTQQIRALLQLLIDRGIALEVNISGGVLDPLEWVLELYHDMGGYLITMASDAHAAPDPFKSHFQEHAQLLKKIGFRNVFYFKNRRCYPCTLL